MKYILLSVLLLFATVSIKAQNVGIGITNPSEQLHTTKGVRFESLGGSATRLVFADSTGKLLTLKDSGVVISNTTTTPIPEGTCTQASSSITISGMPLSIQSAKISVKINITHPRVGDLAIYLIAPNGQGINLVWQDGYDGANYINTVFTDEASYKISTRSYDAPFTGYYKPTGLPGTYCLLTGDVSTFGGLGGGSINPNGTWTLKVNDQFIVASGMLENWTISFGDTRVADKYLPKWNNGALSRLSNLFDDGINVGIGTTKPTNKLTVNGSANITNGLTLGSSQWPTTIFVNGSGNFTSQVNATTILASGDLFVRNGKGIIRSSDGTQQKKLVVIATVSTTIPAGGSANIPFTFPESFSGVPDVYVGNITGGGGFAEVIMTVANISASGGSLFVNNPRVASYSPNFSVKIIAIGPQ
jgi:subtilisin-like proprotein convertase family protein